VGKREKFNPGSSSNNEEFSRPLFQVIFTFFKKKINKRHVKGGAMSVLSPAVQFRSDGLD